MSTLRPESSRRRFLRDVAAAAGALLAHGELRGQSPTLSPHRANVTGSGVVGPADEALVQSALFSQRGTGLRPDPAFDPRADVFGRGVIDEATLAAVRGAVRASSGRPARRPITIAWHYGWYNRAFRPPGVQTVRFKGGDYPSSDASVETLFNEQKTEFGISVDAISWIPSDRNGNLLGNYAEGLFRTPNLGSRYVAALYESTIALTAQGDSVGIEHIDFMDPLVETRMVQHFGDMATFLLEARAAGARLFRLDGRPVVFIFGSHTWGLPDPTGQQLAVVDRAIDRAREAFARAFGQLPYIVGEEILLSSTADLTEDRRHRSQSFDATHVYHHASSLKMKSDSGHAGQDVRIPLSARYVEHQLGILDRAYEGVEPLRNRYTGAPILVIPNLSPGFAKPGLPTLVMTRPEYAEFMRVLERHHLDTFVTGAWADRLGTPAFPAPMYIVGSWNEEFEGHAVFPAEFNESFGPPRQAGFDLVMAIKEVFGWNHYATRDIL